MIKIILKPTTIARIVYAKNSGRGGEGNKYLCNDGRIYSKKELVLLWQARWDTIRHRIKAYGLTSPMVSFLGKIPLETSRIHRLTPPEKKSTAKTVVKEEEKVGADFDKAGNVLCRSGKTIPATAKYDDLLFTTPPKYQPPAGRKNTPKIKKEKKQKFTLRKVKSSLVKVNEGLLDRGMITPGDFNSYYPSHP